MFFKALLVSFACAEAAKEKLCKDTGKDCEDALCVEKSAVTTTPAPGDDTVAKKVVTDDEETKPDDTVDTTDETADERRLSDDSSSSSTDAPEEKTLCSANKETCEKQTDKTKCEEVMGCSEKESGEDGAPACTFSAKDGCECSNGAVAKGVAFALLA